MSKETTDTGPNSKGVAFGLWLACVFGLCGLQRFYLGRPVTGLIYLFTFGLLGVGQLYDLIRLPAMVEHENTNHAALQALAEQRALRRLAHYHLLPAAPSATPALPAAPARPDTPEQLRIELVRAAAKHEGRLTVTQGVMATGKSFEVVEQELDGMARSGYVGIDNHPDTGAVVYTFGELG